MWIDIESELLQGQKLQGVDTCVDVYEVISKSQKVRNASLKHNREIFPLFSKVYSIALGKADVRSLLDSCTGWQIEDCKSIFGNHLLKGHHYYSWTFMIYVSIVIIKSSENAAGHVIIRLKIIKNAGTKIRSVRYNFKHFLEKTQPLSCIGHFAIIHLNLEHNYFDESISSLFGMFAFATVRWRSAGLIAPYSSTSLGFGSKPISRCILFCIA